jgi:hypothetical protein
MGLETGQAQPRPPVTCGQTVRDAWPGPSALQWGKACLLLLVPWLQSAFQARPLPLLSPLLHREANFFPVCALPLSPPAPQLP